MYEHNTIEVFSLRETRAVVSKDLPLMSTKESYRSENALTYYVLLNTWILLWRNFAVHAWTRLKVHIMNNGLIPTINLMQEEAMRLVNGEELGPWARILYAEVRMGHPTVDRNLFDSPIGIDDDATVLFLLRYPKRFSPSSNNEIQAKTLQDFIQTENRTKMLQSRPSYGYWYCSQIVKDYIQRMYPWSEICQKIQEIKPWDIHFSSGAATDARATLGDKVTSVMTSGLHNDYQMLHFGVRMVGSPATAEEPQRRISKIVAVPKSYKSSRIIAMEDSYRNAYCQCVEDIFRTYDKKLGLINLEDQGINQNYAKRGSEDGSLATLDASHASDLISRSLFCDVFPPEYVRLVLPYLPTHCSINGKVKPLQMIGTSGHTLTFRHETIVYKAIAACGVSYHCAITGDDFPQVSHAFGDDTIISSAAYDTVVHFFTRLGLVINNDKSYHDGGFRESCGKDYLYGTDVTSVYYPRFPVVGSMDGNKASFDARTYRDAYRGKIDNSLTMLIDLQKKLFPYSYDAARFVLSIIKSAVPSMTTSVAGEVCSDLWDYVDSGIRRVPQAYRLEHIGRYSLPKVSKAVPLGSARDQLSDDNRRVFDRASALDTIHSYPQVSHSTSRSFTKEEEAIYDYWKLTNFLKVGPDYDNGLDKLLGISKKPMSISEFFGETRLLIVRR